MKQKNKIKDNIPKFIKENIEWIILSISIVIVIGLIEDIFATELMKCDTIAYSIFIMYLRNPFLTAIMKFITTLGGAPVLITISLISIVILKNKKIGICITGNLINITILNIVLKNTVQRPRPEGYRLINETGYSFPSGHSMVNTAFYGLIIYFIYKNVKNIALRNALCILLGILILLIGISRIYLGVHYASDVIAGLFISLAYLIIVTKIIEKNKKE